MTESQISPDCESQYSKSKFEKSITDSERMSPRAQTYQDLNGIAAAATSSPPWYWRALATISSVVILGGFLMLSVTYDTDPQSKISSTALGIFALTILILGVVATLLIALLVRNQLFRSNTIFTPALISCAVGFLNVFYNFIVSSRFVWNLPATMTAVFSAVGVLAYGVLLIWTNRKIKVIQTSLPISSLQDSIPIVQSDADSNQWQAPKYYQNYVKNMFPSASYQPTTQPYEQPINITEEEKQRQQMLMLLLSRDEPTRPNGPSSSTFRIEWQGQEHEPMTPNPFTNAARIPDSGSAFSQTQYNIPGTALNRLSRQFPAGELRPWDGVWRGVAQQPVLSRNPTMTREDRRRQIEMNL